MLYYGKSLHLKSMKRKKKTNYQDGVYFLKVNNKSTKTVCEICSNLKITTPKGRQ